MIDGFRKKFVNVSLPKDLVEEIDRLVVEKSEMYKSRAELVKQVTQEHLKELAAWDKKRNEGVLNATF